MKKFDEVMMVIYWVIFTIVSIAAVLYATVDKVRTWINKHIIVPYVKGCEKISEEIEDMYYDEED